MGCPVRDAEVASARHRRFGLYLLSVVGLGELVADSQQRYVQIATDLAKDPVRLLEMRRTLRDRMDRLPLMDAPRVAREFVQALRVMWREWSCESRLSAPGGRIRWRGWGG
jgi:predicted O-linked N-acetylglucosamine transferase (SPINDLY family)